MIKPGRKQSFFVSGSEMQGGILSVLGLCLQ